ncbi:hypothetical protein BS17DRAFT_779452 [Gyrodon lividus]|nr:hypothetical protein BS17DRAFT_779452 [Gyrodon lividus]
MYNRSRIILALLLVYIPSIVLSVAGAAIDNYRNTYLTVSAAKVVKLCIVTGDTDSLLTGYDSIPQFILSFVLCILAVKQFARHSLQLRRSTKQWRPNRFMELFARESILYFIAHLVYNAASLVGNCGPAHTVLSMVSSIIPYALAPRFIISVRQLHSHVVGGHVDTGFGMAL